MFTKENCTKATFDAKKFTLNYMMYFFVILLVIVYTIMSPNFLTVSNIKGVFVNASPLLLVATGMAFVLITGEIDLSVGSIASVSAMTWIVLITKININPIIATIIAILVAGLMGVVNALLITKLKINSFLVTLGMQTFLRGVTYLIDESRITVPENVKDFTNIKVFGFIPSLVAVSVGLIILMAFVYLYTPIGRNIQAVGCNRIAASKIGVNVNQSISSAFVFAALFAGLAGIIQVLNVGRAMPADIGEGIEFLAITACVLGGVSLYGGTGTLIPGVLIGVYFYQIIENGLGVLGASPYLYPIVKGIVIFAAMVTDSLKRMYYNSKI